MLNKSKRYPSNLCCYILARRTTNFYRTSFQYEKVVNIPCSFMRWEHHLRRYIADIEEEMYILGPTDSLQKLHADLKDMLDHAI